MSTASLTLSPEYLPVARNIRELRRLDVAGLSESPEADAIRDASDRLWAALSEPERERARWLSDDLISITEPPDLRPITPEARQQFAELAEASFAGQWDRALALLRGLRSFLAPEVLSSHRASIWLAMGDPATADVFLDHAARYSIRRA